MAKIQPRLPIYRNWQEYKIIILLPQSASLFTLLCANIDNCFCTLLKFMEIFVLHINQNAHLGSRLFLCRLLPKLCALAWSDFWAAVKVTVPLQRKGNSITAVIPFYTPQIPLFPCFTWLHKYSSFNVFGEFWLF